MLRKQLKCLPATLPQTYERILLNIEENYSHYVLKLLQWLTYSKQPLSLLELAEVVATDEDEDPRFNPERRFPEPEDILLMCSSLVATTEEKDYSLWNVWREGFDIESVVKVKLAHFSVKEYLVSSQIMNGDAGKYSIQEIDANVRIARDCLSYILYFTEDIPGPASHEYQFFSDQSFSDFPLARYATQEWQRHARVGGKINEESMMELIMELFTSDGNAFSSWCLGQFQQYNGNVFSSWCLGKFQRYNESETPLYYASKLNLLGVAKRLITMGVDVNACSGRYSNALCVASSKGHTEIVKLLLEKGADTDSLKHDWNKGSAIYHASVIGHDVIVRLLLDAGAEVEIEEYSAYHSALHAAAANGHASIVTILISSGMDVNLKVGKPRRYDDTAVGLASMQGHDKVAKLLIEAGADPDSKNAALHVASDRGHDEMVKLLLGAGANINRGWLMASPLRVAAWKGNPTTVKLLLDAGADVSLGGRWDRDSFHDSFYREQPRQVLGMLDHLAAAGAEAIDVEQMVKELEDEVELDNSS